MMIIMHVKIEPLKKENEGSVVDVWCISGSISWLKNVAPIPWVQKHTGTPVTVNIY